MDFANKYRPLSNRQFSGISANFGGRCAVKSEKAGKRIKSQRNGRFSSRSEGGRKGSIRQKRSDSSNRRAELDGSII